MKRLIGILLKTVLPLALGVYLVWYFFDRMTAQDKDFFFDAIKKANYGWIFLSMGLSFFSLLSRAYRWKYVLEPLGYQTKFWNRYHALMIGYIVNLTIPRAGEASRAVMLYRSDGVPFSKSFGTILAERAVDLTMLLCVVLFTISIAHDDFWAIKHRMEESLGGTKTNGTSLAGYIFYAVVFAGVVGLTIVLMLRRFRDKLTRFVKDVFAGIFSIFRSRQPFSYIAHTVFIWVMYITYFGIAFFALEDAKDVPFTGIMIAFIAGSLGISFTNGGIGAFPLLVGLVLNFYLSAEHGDKATGIGCAVGMLIWSSQTVMMILLGALSFVLLPKNFNEKDEPAQ
jgi:glycosyltransferase 2 family protein